MNRVAGSKNAILLFQICLVLQLSTSGASAAETPQKLRVAYAAITAAFSLP